MQKVISIHSNESKNYFPPLEYWSPKIGGRPHPKQSSPHALKKKN
jgi:hypothetical protein